MILVSTWQDGVFVFDANEIVHELAGQCVRQLTLDPELGPLAVVGAGGLYRREPSRAWTRWAEVTTAQLSCCAVAGTSVLAGTDDARMLCVDRSGHVAALAGFQAVPGRERWYAGGMMVDGKYMGPPLGVRSLAVTCDAATLLANVHVGGIPRSVDGGRTWHATIDIDTDVHQVCTHPTQPDLVAAATAVGLAISRDGGATWTLEAEGLHARHCTAVAFVGDDILVSAGADPFVAEGAVYRRRGDREGFAPVAGGLPKWTRGLVDTHDIAASGATVAMADKDGYLYVSHDHGHTWTCAHERLPQPSSVLVLA